MLIRVRLSRAINFYIFGGKRNQMLSTRVYVADIRWAIKTIDLIFFFQPNHCYEAFRYDAKNGGFDD